MPRDAFFQSLLPGFQIAISEARLDGVPQVDSDYLFSGWQFKLSIMQTTVRDTGERRCGLKVRVIDQPSVFYGASLRLRRTTDLGGGSTLSNGKLYGSLRCTHTDTHSGRRLRVLP